MGNLQKRSIKAKEVFLWLTLSRFQHLLLEFFKKSVALGIIALASLTFTPSSSILAQDNEAQRNYYQQVLDSFPQNLTEARRSGQLLQEFNVLLGAGGAYEYLEDFEQAIKLYQQALQVARQIEDLRFADSALSKLTTVYSKLGDNRGISFLKEQLAAARVEKDKPWEIVLLDNLGLAYTSILDYPAAIASYEQQLQLIREQGNKILEEAQTLQKLASNYTYKGDYKQAIPIYKEALTLSRNLEDDNLTHRLISALGTAYRFLGDNEQALANFKAALELAQATGNTINEWLTLRELAQIYTALEDYEQALTTQQQKLNLSRQNNNIYQEAFDLEDLSGAYFWTGDYTQAIELQKSALESFRELAQKSQQKNNFSEAQALEKLGFLYWYTNNLSAAEQSLLASIDIYEYQRQEILKNSNFLSLSNQELSTFAYETGSDIYRILQQVLVAQNRTNEALEASEKGRARAYVDLLVTRLGIDPTKQEISAPNLTEIKQIAKRENTTLVQYTVLYEYGRLYRYRYGKEQPLLKATGFMVWVVKPTGEISFREVKFETQIEELVKKARAYITTEGRSVRVKRGEQTPLQQLHDILIEPIADLLPTQPTARVTFIPQDTLFLVPFTALEDANGTYLIEKHTVLTAPSIQVLDLARRVKNRLTSQQKNLVVGNPIMPSIKTPGGKPQQLSSLPGAEAEAQHIAQLLNTQPLIGDAATETAIVNNIENAKIIHLATHGLLDDFAGVQSSLAFAPNSEDDGFLTAPEIANLNLNAELTVLSACDTGRGKISGDGVVGLSRSFISAGTASLVVSLWAIPDDATAKLMSEFYQNLDGGVDKAQAMRQAMLATKKEFRSPKSWAAFTLIGVVD